MHAVTDLFIFMKTYCRNNYITHTAQSNACMVYTCIPAQYCGTESLIIPNKQAPYPIHSHKGLQSVHNVCSLVFVNTFKPIHVQLSPSGSQRCSQRPSRMPRNADEATSHNTPQAVIRSQQELMRHRGKPVYSYPAAIL